MSKTCYLHVGLHKTASTSFQQTCAKNVDLLRENGLTYPLFSCAMADKSKIANHSLPIYSLFAEKPENYGPNMKNGVSGNIKEVNSSYSIQIDDYLASSGDIILSGEDISGMSKNSLLKFIDKIKYFDYEIKVIALVRSPYSAICSGIQQRIKTGRYFELISFNNCIPTSFETASFRKSNLAAKLRHVFGKSICFHGFEDACANSYGPVGFLLEEFLNQDPSCFEYIKTNESLFNLSVRLQNEFNAINPAFASGKYNPRFQPFPAKVDERLRFSGKFLLTETEYELVEEFVEIETQKLNEIAGLDFSGQLLKFSKPIF